MLKKDKQERTLARTFFNNREGVYSVIVKHIASKRAMLVIGALTLVSCQHDPWANGYLTTQPTEMDIIGKYAPDAASLKSSIKLPMSGELLAVHPSAAIVLSSDHSAEFSGVPADHDGKEPCSITGQGSWSIAQNSGRYFSVYVRIHNKESNSPCGTEFNSPLLLYGKHPPYKLHQVIDDPDLGLVVQFERE